MKNWLPPTLKPTLLLLFFVAAVLVWPVVGFAAAEGKNNIAMAAWQALHDVESENGIPHGLLHSISLVETGQGQNGQILPWPYTVNVNTTPTKTGTAYKALLDLNHLRGLGFGHFNITLGSGKKFDRMAASAAEELLKRTPEDETIKLQGAQFSKRFENKWAAVFFANRMIAAGYNSIDVGLMQVNWKYHSHAFENIAAAFDPYINARYAVSYLLEHRQENDWWGSVGRYHSKTPKYATRYVKNVWAMYQKVHRLGQYGQRG